MNDFVLDPVLEKDCFRLGNLGNSLLLLLNNNRVPWFILVPKTTVKELYELEPAVQQDLFAAINRLSVCIKDNFLVDKLNVATIGNIVSQLHVHVIGRHKNDYCWPGVVWGADGSKPYIAEDLERIRLLLGQKLSKDYSPC